MIGDWQISLKLGKMQLSKYKNKRVLVTGGGGFLGANLVRELLKKQAKVSLFLKSSTKPWRLGEVINQTKIYQVDLSNKRGIKQIVEKIKPEVIFHLAAHGGYPFQTDIDKIIKTNILGTVNLLEATNDINYKNFVNTGTSSEYGYKTKPMKETDSLEPTFFYAASKASASLFCQVLAKQFNKPIVTLRPFSIYGDWEEPSRFIPVMITSCLEGKTIKLIPGKQKRDFLYVKDMTRAYLMAGLKPKLGGEIINIGSGRQYLISKTAEKIIKLVGNKVKVKMGEYKPRKWDTNFWVADRSKAKKLLGWEPKYPLDQGLKESIKWYKSHLKLYAK